MASSYDAHHAFVAMNQHLRRKLTFRAHGQQVVFIKRKQERIEHVWMKAFLWAFYLDTYPGASVEVDIPSRYKPDVVAMDRRRGRPVFWAEAGHVPADKLAHLASHYPDTHLAFAKWDTGLDPFVAMIQEALTGARSAPIDLWRFPPDSAERFVDAQGYVRVDPEHATRRRMGQA